MGKRPGIEPAVRITPHGVIQDIRLLPAKNREAAHYNTKFFRLLQIDKKISEGSFCLASCRRKKGCKYFN
jgi:hypothetical protein